MQEEFSEQSMTIKNLVSNMMESYLDDRETIRVDIEHPISRSKVSDILQMLRSLLFPGFFAQKTLNEQSLEYYTGELLEEAAYHLKKQISCAFILSGSDKDAQAITYEFLERLPMIRRILSTDVQATFDGDPAAYNKDEIILSYPGIYAITVNRVAHELYQLGVPLIPRMMTEVAHAATGIDIHPGATIGHHFFIDHGTGVVIGETAHIGTFVKIYQGVTIGALSTRGGQHLKGVKRHPTISDHVTIYAGASILGGSTVIGEGVVIGSNAFIVKSIPDKTKVSVKNQELLFEQSQSRELTQDEVWYYMI
jgi:serine O-acetyltransferase